jgi:hypothetical protein
MKIIFADGDTDIEQFIKIENRIWITECQWTFPCEVYFRHFLKKVFPNVIVRIYQVKRKISFGNIDGHIEIEFRNRADEVQFILTQENITIDFRKNV